MLFITGDTHGKVIERFSYRQNPALRQLTNDDIIFVLGDFGQPFGPSTLNEAEYVFKFLNDKPWTTFIIGGNHDDYGFWQSCPKVKILNGNARQAKLRGMTYDVFFIDEMSIFDIDNFHILTIPCAESHDVDNLLDPKDPMFKRKRQLCKRHNEWFRVIGQSWWPQEKMNVQHNAEFMEHHINEHFDFIFTHDAPALINSWFKRPGDPARRNSTAGQLFLEEIRKTADFDTWFHGHFHFTGSWNKLHDERMCGIYYEILQLTENFS